MLLVIHITTYYKIITNHSLSTKDGNACINDDMVFDDWMSFYRCICFVYTECTECHALINFDMITNMCCFPNYHPCTVSMKKYSPIVAPGWMSIQVLLCAYWVIILGMSSLPMF